MTRNVNGPFDVKKALTKPYIEFIFFKKMKRTLAMIKNTNGRDIWCATMVVWSVDILIGQLAAA